MTLTEKVAYLKGLAEGLNLDENAKETKLFNAMFDILEEMALSINDIDEDLAAVEELTDCLDADLSDLEEIIYDEECECGCGCGPDCDCGCQDGYECTCDGDCDCGCGCGDELYAIDCPSCGEEIYLDEEIFDEGFLDCPACGETLELDFVPEDCDCDCDDED